MAQTEIKIKSICERVEFTTFHGTIKTLRFVPKVMSSKGPSTVVAMQYNIAQLEMQRWCILEIGIRKYLYA